MEPHLQDVLSDASNSNSPGAKRATWPPSEPAEPWTPTKPSTPQEICKQHFSALIRAQQASDTQFWAPGTRTCDTECMRGGLDGCFPFQKGFQEEKHLPWGPKEQSRV